MAASVKQFFHDSNPYIKYHDSYGIIGKSAGAAKESGPQNYLLQPHNLRHVRCLPSQSSTTSSPLSPLSLPMIIYGSSFSPRSNFGSKKAYFVGCSSLGTICIWDALTSGRQQVEANDPLDSSETGTCDGKRWRRGSKENRNVLLENTPILCVNASSQNLTSNNVVLYDLKFLKVDGIHFLVVSGDPGVLVYKWSDFEDAIQIIKSSEKNIDNEETRSSKKHKIESTSNNMNNVPLSKSLTTLSIKPITRFEPYPSPATSLGDAIEVNSVSFDPCPGVLYGATGDMFGCYQWDLRTERCLGTFGGSSGVGAGGSFGLVGGHKDYLHVVKAVGENCGPGGGEVGSRTVITGGEDGTVGFWDGKERKLVEMINVQKEMDKNRHLVGSDYPNKTYTGNPSTTTWNSGTYSNNSNSWVSCIDVNGDWLAACGGAEGGTNNSSSITGKSSSSNINNGGGFVALWHLPTRTFSSGFATREKLNSIIYHSSLDCFVSGSNECRLSFWSPNTMTRTGRAWSSPAAAYTMATDTDSGVMVVGGSGDILDCFVDRVKVSRLQGA